MSRDYKCVIAKGLYNTGIGLKYLFVALVILSMALMFGLGMRGVCRDPKSFGVALLIIIGAFGFSWLVTTIVRWIDRFVRRHRIAGPCVEQSTYEYDI